MNDELREEIAPAGVVTLQGKDYSLIYDWRAVILYKQKTGDSLCQEGVFSKINPQQDPERFATCLWAGLQRKHPEITFDGLCTMIPFGPEITRIADQMTDAIFAHFPKTKKPSPNEPAPDRPAPTAMTSQTPEPVPVLISG